MTFGIASVTAITVICYLICEGFKTTKLDGKFIPIIAGFCGAVLGIVGFLTKMPDFPATDVLTALAVGIVSGLAATGTHEAVKVLKKDEPAKDEPKEPEETDGLHEGFEGDEV